MLTGGRMKKTGMDKHAETSKKIAFLNGSVEMFPNDLFNS
jgi:hypothetical protein